MIKKIINRMSNDTIGFLIGAGLVIGILLIMCLCFYIGSL